MQTATRGIRATAELPTGMQFGEDHLDPGQPRAGLNVDRNPTAVVPHLNRAVCRQHDVDVGADAGERLVNRVVDDLPETVHKPALVGGADVHARPLAHGFQTLKHL